MSESLEIIFYGQGFTKGHNGGQKPRSGMTIGRGEPLQALLSACSALKGLGYDVDDAYLKWAFKEEVENFKRKL